MSPPASKPPTDPAERLLEAIHMLTAELKATRVTLAKPRPKRLPLSARWRKAEEDYLKAQS